jgi:hypothetical protein
MILSPITQTIVSVQAATTDHMKNVGVNWNLRQGKSVKFTSRSSLAGKKTGTITLKSLKTTESGDYYRTTATLVLKLKCGFTKAQVKKVMHGGTTNFALWRYATVVDYDTGKCLEESNDLDVDVTMNESSSGKYKIYDSDGCYMEDYKTVTEKITIEYPKSYAGLCIVAGGATQSRLTSATNKFFDGKTLFGKTVLASKKDKSYAHGIRINEDAVPSEEVNTVASTLFPDDDE